MRLVKKQRIRKRGDPKKKADSRFVWEETPKDPVLFEFSENPALTQDMPQNDEYAEKVIATSRPLRRRFILNIWVPVAVEEMKKFIVVTYHMGHIDIIGKKQLNIW